MEADFLAQHGQLVLFPPGPLRGRAFRKAQVIEDGAVAAFQGRIVAAGPTQEVRRKLRLLPRATALDCSGKVLLPGFVDCHTHLVHAGTRCDEFEARLRGASRSLLEAGVPLLGGSDSPVEMPDPVVGIKAAVDRHGISPSESISEDRAKALFAPPTRP